MSYCSCRGTIYRAQTRSVVAVEYARASTPTDLCAPETMPLQGAHSDAGELRFTDRFNQRVAGLGGRIAALRAPSLASTRGSESPTRSSESPTHGSRSPLQEKIARLSEQLASRQSPDAQPQLVAGAVANGVARSLDQSVCTLSGLRCGRGTTNCCDNLCDAISLCVLLCRMRKAVCEGVTLCEDVRLCVRAEAVCKAAILFEAVTMCVRGYVVSL